MLVIIPFFIRAQFVWLTVLVKQTQDSAATAQPRSPASDTGHQHLFRWQEDPRYASQKKRRTEEEKNEAKLDDLNKQKAIRAHLKTKKPEEVQKMYPDMAVSLLIIATIDSNNRAIAIINSSNRVGSCLPSR